MPICLSYIVKIVVTVIIVLFVAQKVFQPIAPSVADWIKPANDLCIPRVSAACRGLDYVDRIACVQENMVGCMNKNSSSISRVCLQNVCGDNGLCRLQALQNGICAKPDLN